MCYKLLRHDFGTVIAIGIECTNKDEIEQRFYSFWNHGATTGELHWINDNFAYFWTTPNNLIKSLINSSLFQLLAINKGEFKHKKHGLMPEAKRLAEKRLSEIEYASFLGELKLNNDPYTKPYKMGYLEWFTPDLAELTV